MAQTKSTSLPEIRTGTMGETLDRLEALAGRIGMNTSEQSLALLTGLDDVELALEGQENTASRKTAEAQLEGIYGRLRAEAGGFLRDLGGAQVLASVRENVQPGPERWWWYLDAYLSDQRRGSLRRTATLLGIAAVVIAILAVVYQAFLAPSEQTAAVYQAENATQELLASGQYEEALAEVEKGLAYSPNEPSLLVVKGIVLEALGQADAAAQAFDRAEQASPGRLEFLVVRGQTYLSNNQLDRALADGQEAVQLNPQSAQAHLLVGSVYETQGNLEEALKSYDLSFEAASKGDQPELAAIVRYRTAMLMQSMNMQVTPPAWMATPTP